MSGVARLDIVIPAYNESENIIPVLESFRLHVHTPFRVLICYDRDDDTTLTALREYRHDEFELAYVKNRGTGAFAAVTTGLTESRASIVLVFPADDDYNAPRIDGMVRLFDEGCDIVAASRFMPGGSMTGCPLLKRVLVRTSAFALRHIARLPTHDPSNGLRFFSRRVLDAIAIESTEGFTYSIELLVKCHRLGWKVCERPAEWHQRLRGTSRFHAVRWLPGYWRWFCYAFATTYLRRGPQTVTLRSVRR